jgi:hypothetical protein
MAEANRSQLTAKKVHLFLVRPLVTPLIAQTPSDLEI